MLTTPPPNNLGPMSQEWGRYITVQTRQNAEAIERMGGDASNDGQVNNSTMDQMASQLNEVNQRQSAFTVADSITTAPFNGGGTNAPMVARNIEIPRPADVARSGWLALTFDVSQTTNEFTVAFFTIYIDGNPFHKSSIGFPVSTVTPASWGSGASVSAFTGFVAGPSFGGLVRVEMTGTANFGTVLRTVTASNFQVTNQYSQKA